MRNSVSTLRDTRTTDFKYFITFTYYFSMCMYVCVMAHTWRSEAGLQRSLLSFSHVGLWDQTRVVSLGGKLCNPPSPSASPVAGTLHGLVDFL